jgi:hypothetical protein
MSRTNNSVWAKLSSTLSEVLTSTLDQASAESVMSAWDSKKREVNRLVDKSPKKKADPNAPKKPLSAYIIFCNNNREAINKADPTITAKQVLQKLGAAWKSISEKEKKHYEELAKKDVERYENQMKGYTPTPETEVKGRGKKSDGPTRPMTAYMFFCQAERENVKRDHPTLPGKEITKKLGEKWHTLSDDQKAPFEAKQVSDKARYESEKGSTGTKHETKEVKESKGKSTKKTETKKSVEKSETKKATDKSTVAKKASKSDSKADSKPKKDTKTVKKSPGYEYFLKEQTEEVRAEHPKMTEKQLVTEVNKRWTELSDAERTAYENEADVGSEVELDD